MKTIVIVEDSYLIRRSLAAWLADDFNVYIADNAHLALELIEERRPDYLLLNPLLAGNSGWELLYEIATWPDLRRLRTILLTHETYYLKAYRRSLRELNVHSILAWVHLTPRRLRQSLIS